MNSIRQTQALNKRELEAAVPPSASWHADYRDTAYVYVGGLAPELSEGDLLTVFSQYGNPTHLNLVRDRETGKSRGFAFLKYEDQRSCDLAVDNLGGAEVLGRVLRVDHTRYRKKEGEDEDTWRVERLEAEAAGAGVGERGSGDWEGAGGERIDDDDEGARRKRGKRAMIKEERELAELLRLKEGEEEDPMRQYLIEQKKAEVDKALARIERRESHRHKHHHHRHHKEEDRELDPEHKSHRHRADVDDGRRHSRHHHRRHRRHGELNSQSRRNGRDDEDAQSYRRQRRYSSDHGSSSTSRSPGRRRRDGARSVSRSGMDKPKARGYLSSKRGTDLEDDRVPPSRSRSRSRSTERRRYRT